MKFLKNNKGVILFYLMTAVFTLIIAYKPIITENSNNDNTFAYNQK